MQDGKWGVPMALIDRYSYELQSTMREVTKEMDHIRIEKLNHTASKTAVRVTTFSIFFTVVIRADPGMILFTISTFRFHVIYAIFALRPTWWVN